MLRYCAPAPAWLVSGALHAICFVLLGLAFSGVPARPLTFVGESVVAEVAEPAGGGWENLDAPTALAPAGDGGGVEDSLEPIGLGASIDSALQVDLPMEGLVTSADSAPSDRPLLLASNATGIVGSGVVSDSLLSGDLGRAIVDGEGLGGARVAGEGGPGGVGRGDGKTPAKFGRTGSSFFGVQSTGASFIYVVDISGSMGGERFQRAIAELRRSIESLTPDQRFFIIFFNSDVYPQPDGQMVRATTTNVGRTLAWMSRAACTGETYPLNALLHALSLQPDAIYFLTDGQFDPRVVEVLRTTPTYRPIPIHTIGFITRDGEPLLQAIAGNSGGTYTYVP